MAREKIYLAQIEALPLSRIEAFIQDSVANGAAQFVALDGELVVGWADILPKWAHALAHCRTLGMGLLPGYRGQGIGRQLLAACISKAGTGGITRIELEARADTTAPSGCTSSWAWCIKPLKNSQCALTGSTATRRK